MDDQLNQPWLYIVNLIESKIFNDLHQMVTENVDLGIDYLSERSTFDSLINAGIDLHSVAVDFIRHIHKQNLILFSNQNVVDFSLKLSLWDLLLLSLAVLFFWLQ